MEFHWGLFRKEKEVLVHVCVCVCVSLTEVQFSDASPFLGRAKKLHLFFSFWKWKASAKGSFPSTAHSFIRRLNNVDLLYLAQIIPPGAFFLTHYSRGTRPTAVRKAAASSQRVCPQKQQHPSSSWNWNTPFSFSFFSKKKKKIKRITIF